MPYPAIPLGKYFGLQFGHVLAALLIALYWRKVLSQKNLLLIVLSLMLPTLPAILMHSGNTTNVNTALSHFFALWVLLAMGTVGRQNYRNLLIGVFFAISLHSVIGLVQQYEYLSEDFPLLDLYINPSFAPLDEGNVSWQTYAYYTKRSFGLFPEPSAMFASLGPWMVLLGFLALTVRKGLYDAHHTKLFWLWVVFLLGLSLIAFGRSGGTFSLIAGLSPAMFVYIKKISLSPNFSEKLKAILLSAFAVLVLYALFALNEDRIYAELQNDGSWEERASSIQYGFTSLVAGDFLDFLFGYGLGQVAPMTMAATGATSVHSLVGSYIMGTGMVGATALFSVFLYIVNKIHHSNERMLGYSIYFVWFFCANLVSGYYQLLSMWMMLGLLANWQQLHPPIKQYAA